eukprot:snap_masked-scaffold_24-processed-gene-3.5-mRNA-1 protein AED:1.00 eAED:1.00 QI:0/-1/0/0/-1/1/1/0/223
MKELLQYLNKTKITSFFMEQQNTPLKQAVEILLNETATIETEIEFKNNLSNYRFAHLNNKILKKNNLKTSKKSFCIGCSAEKLAKKKKGSCISTENTTLFVPQKKFGKLYYDTVGPFPVSLRRFKYAVTVVDSFTNYILLITTRAKENISKQLENVILKIENRYSTYVKCLFSDNGSKFKRIQKFAESKGISLETSSNYMPSENGKAERYDRTVFHSMKALLQ